MLKSPSVIVEGFILDRNSENSSMKQTNKGEVLPRERNYDY